MTYRGFPSGNTAVHCDTTLQAVEDGRKGYQRGASAAPCQGSLPH